MGLMVLCLAFISFVLMKHHYEHLVRRRILLARWSKCPVSEEEKSDFAEEKSAFAKENLFFAKYKLSLSNWLILMLGVSLFLISCQPVLIGIILFFYAYLLHLIPVFLYQFLI